MWKNRWTGPTNFFRKFKGVLSRSLNEPLLNELLCQDLQGAPLPEKMYWLERVLRWLFRSGVDQQEARFRFLFSVLEKNPVWRQHLRAVVSAVLEEAHFLGLFVHVGVAVEHGLWGDMLDRVLGKFIPASGGADFRQMLLNAFDYEESARAVVSLSDETSLRIREFVCYDENARAWADIQVEADEALLFLSTHAAHYGISSNVRNRLPRNDKISKSSFCRLGKAFHSSHGEAGHGARLEAVLADCERDVDLVYASLEKNGVSVDAVNRLETLSALLRQIRAIVRLREPGTELGKCREISQFLQGVIKASLQERSIVGHVRRHFYLLSRKIVERNGQSGEHYIARSRPELLRLLWSAMGGGGIVVLMTIFKTGLISLQLAPLFLATGIWVTYSAGFLAMQFLGCTLATKIPSFTASRLAGLLKTVRRNSAGEFQEEFRLVIRSQAMALLGNIVAVVPLALGFNFLFARLGHGDGLMTEHYARHTLRDLHPWLSFAVPLGALTGVELWLSSVVGGWFENWVVFNRLPGAVEYHFRLRKFFGEKAAKNLGQGLLRHSSGVATNVALGFLFGFVPLVGQLFGLNWNGNHVTISTAGAAFALSSLHFAIPPSELLALGIGLGLIGLLNFVVSFSLALAVAGNAQKMKLWRVWRYVSVGLSPKRLAHP